MCLLRGVFQCFLEARESERRLAQLRERLEGGREQIPPPVQEELTSWLEEQQKEVSTFAAHCNNRQQQMQSTLNTFNRSGSRGSLTLSLEVFYP